MRTTVTRLAAALAAGALLVPAGASVASADPVAGRSERAACLKEARHTFRDAVVAARQAKKNAFKAARDQFLADTAEERATLVAALAAATTRAERRAAVEAFLQATADERAARRAAKRTALATFKASMLAAKAQFRTDRAACLAA